MGAPAEDAPAELSPEELAKLSKEERTAYYKKRNAAKAAAKPKAKVLSKAERREIQEQQRKVKDDKKAAVADNSEMLEELKLQGLSEEQAREVMTQLEKETAAAEDDDDDEAEETLVDSVRIWMAANDQEKSDDDSLRDFNLKVRFQGHVDSTPPDHLQAMLQVIAEEAKADEEVMAAKQPNAVAKKFDKVLARWGYLLGEFYKRSDALTAAGIVVDSVGDVLLAASPVAFVGVMMAIRENVEPIEDEDLLTGCRKIESDSRVVQGFIGFLEEAAAESDEEGSGSDGDK
eukprot:TRINITY_DN14504_c0_g1_i1.p1 TRINITY_DN14504_c0_g1~~TRINITY_DN14504_c0_g1_i1.p1  ORF type:complete len:336 (-),score=108.35 TRINITY_DN14504_c0_g1_i1:66-932(-)